MLEKGFHSVGLNQILSAVQVPKGSFYHYFSSKEQFGVELLQHYVGNSTAQKRKMLLPTEIETDPIQRLFVYLDGGIQYTEQMKGKFPCLVLKLAAEVTVLSEPMREELAKGFEDWVGIFKELLDEAIDKALLPHGLDTYAEAELIHDLWSGATQRAVINQNVAPVRQAVQHIKSRLNNLLV